MRKSKAILITTVAVVIMLTVPFAAGLATLSIGGNVVELKEHPSGGTEVESTEGHTMGPSTQGGHDAFVVKDKNGNENLLDGDRNVEFELVIPQGTSFVIWIEATRVALGAILDLDVYIDINGQPFQINIHLSLFQYGDSFYYSAKKTVGNTNKLEGFKTLTEDDYMKCEMGDATINVEAGRNVAMKPNLVFKIVYL